MSRPVGMLSSSPLSSEVAISVLLLSTAGASPVTFTVSETAWTFICTSTLATKFAVMRMPSRLCPPNPDSSNLRP